MTEILLELVKPASIAWGTGFLCGLAVEAVRLIRWLVSR